MNKVFSFPSNFQVNVAPFGTPEGITASTNVDVELIRYLTESAIILAVKAQASLGRVRRNNISKEIYGSEVLQPIKIKDTPKMFDETETERVRKLAKSIRKNNEAKQSELGLPNFCQEGVTGLKECITKEVQDLLVDDAIEQVLPNQYSKLVFYSNVFTVPKPGTNLFRPVLDLKRLNTFIANQSFKMEAYLHVLVDQHYRDLFRFVWKGVHYRWKTMSQEESQLDWRAHSRILQCQSRPPQRSCRVESQVINSQIFKKSFLNAETTFRE
ncbi:hypothetical protein ACTFIU_005705 [Dictyostelium citrinum]